MIILNLRWGEYATTINDLVDAHDMVEKEHMWIKAKLADLEDGSRRNNVKIRGIPESIQSPELRIVCHGNAVIINA